MKSMEEALEIFTKITGTSPKSISPLYGGLNSVNYLIDNLFVLRIKGKPIDHFYSATQEKEVENLIAPYDLGVKVIFLDSKDGTKITKFISNTKFLNPETDKKEIKQVAIKLAKLHSIEPENIQPFNSIERYLIYKKNSKITESFKFENELIKYISSIDADSPKVLCHNDLVKGNLLFKNRDVFLIDYEYAGTNNPLFDLASFITENDIQNPTFIDYFLSEYKKIKSIRLDAFDNYCKFLDLLWFYWAKAMFSSTNQEIYNSIAKTKEKRLIQYQFSK